MRSVHAPEYKAILTRLVRARELAGLSQGDAARLLGVPQSRLSRMESGERRIDVLELLALAELYHRPRRYFLRTALRRLP